MGRPSDSEPRTSGARGRLRRYFLENIGRVITSDELRRVAGISEWARRVRELRDEEGLPVLTHNDRQGLKPNEYLLESSNLRPVIARGISAKLRKRILERNGFTCQACGAGPGEEAPCEPGKRVRLQIDHILPISQGGTDHDDNLRAVCVYYNKDKANILKPVAGQSIAALAMIRKLPRDAQRKVYEHLKAKFDDRPARSGRKPEK
ncbi:MAG: HNH endonuclease [Phycisphaerae bacterium]